MSVYDSIFLTVSDYGHMFPSGRAKLGNSYRSFHRDDPSPLKRQQGTRLNRHWIIFFGLSSSSSLLLSSLELSDTQVYEP